MITTTTRPIKPGYAPQMFDATARHEPDDLGGLEEGSYQARIGELQIDFTLSQTDHAAKRLFVILAGQQRADAEWPLEQLPRKFTNLPGTTVLVNDPTLALTARHAIGWFFGSREQSGIVSLSLLVDSLRQRLGVDRHRIYIVGEASSGLAAIQLGCKIGDCSVISINPHTDIRLYNRAYVADFFAHLAVSDPSVQSADLEFNTRLSAVDALRDSQETRVMYYEGQHNADKPNRHFQHFCREFGIDEDEQLSDLGTLQVIRSNDAAEAPVGFRQLMSRAIKLAERTAAKPVRSTAVEEVAPAARRSGPNPFLTKLAPPDTLVAHPWGVCGSLKELDSTSIQNGRFVVRHRGGEFQCLLNIKPDSNKLFVMLCGATNRRFAHPDFHRVSWAPEIPGSTLYVADPTLGVTRKLSLAWYVGTRDNDWGTGLAEMVRAVAGKLGLGTDSVITYGSSGGGFAALMTAARLGDATAVAINPQTHVLQYHPKNVRTMLLSNFGTSEYEELPPSLVSQRFDAIRAFRDAPKAKLLYLQNVNDIHHYEEHYLPFCEKLGLPIYGGVKDGHLETWPYKDAHGHRGEPPALVPDILAKSIALSDIRVVVSTRQRTDAIF
ncbi:alpha/beta hydrolase family protein [Bordetella petrii]|uniref:alpha/beta hydrolase family protein n=1 Tax=Bordetella petrii TaxID=94624 RepID=UPI0012DCAE37|nr:hypothetical protein [Bordetella petrii]